ncbi:MAG TPA: MBL fold metallo-hydrolase [bacterium]|nr:MBL fold metallo-hydrolase [bacterium]HMW31757.1 MBL fold metallo-hydrolase [bacterium]HMW36816.1 MBL fold metallo-hydrolase [bacterium]HMY35281.1 MBL fold metallo-hydrolase [bacterium]HMZ05705.1 MBL fold metallo-hydrolase [bacterium]
MKFTLLGTRGSRPILTPDRVRYGGNTTAFKITIDGMQPIYIDGGTGIYREGVTISEQHPEGFHAHFFITHTHWDHILAFPLFAPLFNKNTKISISGPRSEEYTIEELFKLQHAKGLIPIPFSLVRDKITFHELHPDQTIPLENATVKTVQLNHQGLTLGYRIEHGGKSVLIITDHAPIENNHLGVLMKAWNKEDFTKTEKEFYENMVRFCTGADIMLHDTHFTKEGIKGKENWGHSTPEMAVDLAVKAGVKKIILGHHAPEDTDTFVEQKITSANDYVKSIGKAGAIEVVALREGTEVWV